MYSGITVRYCTLQVQCTTVHRRYNTLLYSRLAKSEFRRFCRTRLFSDFPRNLTCFPPNYKISMHKIPMIKKILYKYHVNHGNIMEISWKYHVTLVEWEKKNAFR